MSAAPPRRGLVLGASAGIGAAVVAHLAGSGAEVHAASRRGTCPVESPNVVARSVDVRSYREVRGLIEQLAEGNRLSFVVNSAGIGSYAPLGEDHSEAWREIVETNLLGTVHVCSALLEVDVELGQLVQIGSLAAFRVSKTPGNAIYSAAKAASSMVVDHARTLLRERGTRVSVVAPGFVEGTEFGERFFDRVPQARRPLYQPGQNLKPEEIAQVVAYVLETPPHVDLTELVVRPVGQPD
jgi:NADP-dependent 3-hydroxy acid dehydrogenase YdfG